MRLETFTYAGNEGWSVDSFPGLDSDTTVVFVFGASGFLENPAPLLELCAAYPRAQVIGCSSAGEIQGRRVVDGSLSVAVARFRSTRLVSAVELIDDPSCSFETGRRLAERMRHPDLAGVTVLSDGIHVNGSALVSGLSSILGSRVVVTGGLAGDGANFRKTWVLRNGQLGSGMVAAVGFYGRDVRIGHGSQGGWENFGPERVITRSENHILYELDGAPALSLYKEYLGERAIGLPASALLLPLEIRIPGRPERRLVRTVLGIDEAKQAMIFAGDMPEGAYARLMQSCFDRLIAGASSAASQIPHGYGDAAPTLAIAVSCLGRRLILGERIEEEVEATLRGLPSNTRQVGFYSYGEFSPHIRGDRCELHNQTMTLTTIREEGEVA